MEWRRSRVTHGKIDYFILYYKSPLDDSYYKRKIDVTTANTSDLYLVSCPLHNLYSSIYSEIANNTNNQPCQTQLTNLRNFTTYNLAVSAITKSRQAPGKLYESQFSSYHQIFVSPGCEVRTELVSVFARSVLKILNYSINFSLRQELKELQCLSVPLMTCC